MDNIKWIPENLKPLAQEKWDTNIAFRAEIEKADRSPEWRKYIIRDLEKEYNR